MCTATSLKPLIILQKKAIRIIFKVPNRANTLQLFINNEILPLEQIIEFSSCLFMFDYLHGNLPASFDLHWIENWRANENNYELRNANNFHIPRVRYKYLDTHPLFNFSRLWNNLPLNLKSINERSRFEKSLQEFLFEKLSNI
jgi:hypothetical protein